MNAKQRRIKYRELARKNGFYYVVFRFNDEAVATARHVVSMSLEVHNKDQLIMMTYQVSGKNGRFSYDTISEAEATTLVEFGVPLHCGSNGVVNLDVDVS